MKKLIIILLAIVSAATAANAQFRFAGLIGSGQTTLNFKQDIVTVDKAVGLQAGVLGEIIFPGIGFGIDLGLTYNLTGAKVNLGEKPMWSSQGYGNEHLMLHELNIPFHLRFKYTRLAGLEDIVAPFVFAGPEFSILLGHSKCKAMQYPGGDLSLGFGGGVELFKRWQVSASYTRGMTYVIKAKILSDYSAKANQWTVRVAYFF
ncbi:MAG: porin family protein [Clostridium sp.]|nr:porin family protein [Clostridium sp.]